MVDVKILYVCAAEQYLYTRTLSVYSFRYIYSSAL